MPEVFVTDAQIAARYSVHRTWPWRKSKTDKTFPRPVKLSPQCTRWRLSDIEKWEAARNSDAA